MAVANDIAADVSAVDAFWSDSPKSLAGPPPEFGVALFHREGSYEWRANWPIADSAGIVGPAALRFVVRPGTELGPSISVIFNRQAVARLDFVPAQECGADRKVKIDPLTAPERVAVYTLALRLKA
jgi:hypothetical protein